MSAPNGYDIIGDVHGCYDLLRALLRELGYRSKRGSYCHPHRQAIFLGDIIDRGPQIRPALELVRAMVERGQAQLLLGNHEYNLLAYCTPRQDGSGDYLHRHSPRRKRNLGQTLEQFDGRRERLLEHVEWLKRQPLFLQLSVGGQSFRCVHACWHARAVSWLSRSGAGGERGAGFWQQSIVRGSEAKFALDCCLRGLHLPLPQATRLLGNDGGYHDELRVKFWQQHGATYGDVAISLPELDPELAAQSLSAEQQRAIYCYTSEQPPLFFGHYWFTGEPELLAPNLACLDYSAVRGGPLLAYRYDGEARLQAEKLLWVRG